VLSTKIAYCSEQAVPVVFFQHVTKLWAVVMP